VSAKRASSIAAWSAALTFPPRGPSAARFPMHGCHGARLGGQLLRLAPRAAIRRAAGAGAGDPPVGPLRLCRPLLVGEASLSAR
jgi:hypothetical protein